ncbi:peptidoglycan DD-metalloendopeptidase family protein [Candidatus Falkowbacteria bacterium]|jgi:murein DD-endopeptidase MepM/ murein hydrolase activator NlpD|nr:peptidoglycan DD-metalloendopeptidase family protein [Candidatus Falkowbacteria bacterium]MBT7007550.1 peptidoglycan DD-metalloendopeptidase family protein [Candidatus Falkowbacteria bacterium]
MLEVNKNRVFQVGIIGLMVFVLVFPGVKISAQGVADLTNQIESKKDEVNDIKKQMAVYEKNIANKQAEAMSLYNQIDILENQIAKTKLDISATQKEIEQIKLENREVELKIITIEDKISGQKNNLATIIQEIHQADKENPLKIFLSNNSMSDFFNQTEYIKDLQNGLQDSLGTIKQEKKELVTKKEQIEKQEEQLAILKEELEVKIVEQQGETIYKDTLLVQTKESEAKYQQLYTQAKQEHQSISSEIYSLEQAYREKLKQKKAQNQPVLTDSALSWPVPQRRITSTFHDPDYPFRYLFEHPAIDVASSQGTKITAPAEGYVLKAKDNGMGYSYISLIHADGISTVFGHVSKIYVKNDEYVSKGEVIGLTGGMPGTPGAGRLCTGPHLHFEVRLNGIPVNPLNYLP